MIINILKFSFNYNCTFVRSDLTSIRENQQEIKTDQLEMKSNIGKIISDQKRITEELTLLKTGQTKLETLLNHLIENFKPINDALKEATKKVPKPSIGRSCAEATFTTRSSGVYDILIPSYSDQPFKVACSADFGCGNWTVILQRKDGSENFYRNWTEYQAGFGNLSGEFFLGLDKIHAITNDQPQELLIRLEDFDGEVRFASYDAFAIGDESELYRLNTVGKASGNAGDSLTFHHGLPFSSRDKDNDMGAGNCAVDCHGGWWFKECHKR